MLSALTKAQEDTIQDIGNMCKQTIDSALAPLEQHLINLNTYTNRAQATALQQSDTTEHQVLITEQQQLIMENLESAMDNTTALHSSPQPIPDSPSPPAHTPHQERSYASIAVAIASSASLPPQHASVVVQAEAQENR